MGPVRRPSRPPASVVGCSVAPCPHQRSHERGSEQPNQHLNQIAACFLAGLVQGMACRQRRGVFYFNRAANFGDVVNQELLSWLTGVPVTSLTFCDQNTQRTALCAHACSPSALCSRLPPAPMSCGGPVLLRRCVRTRLLWIWNRLSNLNAAFFGCNLQSHFNLCVACSFSTEEPGFQDSSGATFVGERGVCTDKQHGCARPQVAGWLTVPGGVSTAHVLGVRGPLTVALLSAKNVTPAGREAIALGDPALLLPLVWSDLRKAEVRRCPDQGLIGGCLVVGSHACPTAPSRPPRGPGWRVYASGQSDRGS
jgi:hypothetical protein